MDKLKKTRPAEFRKLDLFVLGPSLLDRDFSQPSLARTGRSCLVTVICKMHKRRRRKNFAPVMSTQKVTLYCLRYCFLALMPQICFRKLTPPFDYSLKLTSFDIQETSVIMFCNKCLFVR